MSKATLLSSRCRSTPGQARRGRGPVPGPRLELKGCREAFTLVELLVVIAILSLLVAILSPVIGRAQDAARLGACAKNLRTLQTGMTLYASNSGMQISGLDWYANTSWVADLYWEIWWGDKGRKNIEYGLIWPYVKHHGPYLCPTFEKVCRRPPVGAESRPGVAYGTGYSGWGGTVPGVDLATFEPSRSYSLNQYIGRDKKNFLLLSTSDRVWLCDDNPWRNLYLQDDLGEWDPAYGINNGHLGLEDTPAEYHEGKANCVFADGHVERRDPVAIHLNLAD